MPSFIQNQFCSDSRALQPGQWQYSAWLEPKGRIRAFFHLLRSSPERFHVLLRGGTAVALAEPLQRFVFRAKVKIEVTPPVLPWPIGEHSASAEPGVHPIVAATAGVPPTPDWSGDTVDAPFALAEIRAGLPRLPVALQDELLSAWLDFDRLGAISFKKGCYPGQEIAARMYFRGGNSRRLHPLRIVAADDPTAATIRGEAGQEGGRVLQAVAVGERIYEALAVLRDGIDHAGLKIEGDGDARIEVISPQWATTP